MGLLGRLRWNAGGGIDWICCTPQLIFTTFRRDERFSVWGEKWFDPTSRRPEYEFLMKDIASGRLLLETNSLTNRSTSEETTIGGEGGPPELVTTHEIEEKFGISGVPYQRCFLEDEGKPGEGGKI